LTLFKHLDDNDDAINSGIFRRVPVAPIGRCTVCRSVVVQKRDGHAGLVRSATTASSHASRVLTAPRAMNADLSVTVLLAGVVTSVNYRAHRQAPLSVDKLNYRIKVTDSFSVGDARQDSLDFSLKYFSYFMQQF